MGRKVVLKVIRAVEASSFQKTAGAGSRAAAGSRGGGHSGLRFFGLASAPFRVSELGTLRACVAPMSLWSRSGMFQAAAGSRSI